MTDIAKHIEQLANKGDEVYAVACEVLAIDYNEHTCKVKPLNGAAEIFKVRLQSEKNKETGFVIMPVVGSNVVVNFLNKNTAYVSMCSNVDYVNLRGDELGGLIKIENLVW